MFGSKMGGCVAMEITNLCNVISGRGQFVQEKTQTPILNKTWLLYVGPLIQTQAKVK